MGNSGLSSGNQNADRNVASTSQANGVSDVNKDSIGNWTSGHSCHILAMNLSTFCPYPETLWEVECKGDGLIHLLGGFKTAQQ
jgi:hypothetical protein